MRSSSWRRSSTITSCGRAAEPRSGRAALLCRREEGPIPDDHRRRFTVDDVKASFPPDKAWSEMQGDLICFLVYRQISFYVTPLPLNLGVPVLAVTFSALAVGLGMTWTAAVGGASAYWAVAVLGFAYHVLDCVDGNMARTLGQTSRLGAILDGTFDMTFWCLLLLSTGLMVADAGGGVLGHHAVPFSLGLCVLLLLNRQTRDNFAVQTATATYFKAERPERVGLGSWLLMSVTGLEFAYVIAIAIGGAVGRLDWVLVGIGVYVAAMFIGALAMTFSKAAALDRATSSTDPR